MSKLITFDEYVRDYVEEGIKFFECLNEREFNIFAKKIIEHDFNEKRAVTYSFSAYSKSDSLVDDTVHIEIQLFHIHNKVQIYLYKIGQDSNDLIPVTIYLADIIENKLDCSILYDYICQLSVEKMIKLFYKKPKIDLLVKKEFLVTEKGDDKKEITFCEGLCFDVPRFE